MGVLVAILNLKFPNQKYKNSIVICGLGCFVGGIEILVFMKQPLYIIITGSIVMALLGAGWPIGFWLIRNNTFKKVDLMSEKERKSEEDKIVNEISSILSIEKKEK